jgi:hypothetical protein
VDLSRLYRRAGDEQTRRLGRWRRAALALTAVAGLLLLAFALRLEVRVEQHQLLLRWGSPREVTVPAPLPAPPVLAAGVSAEELQLMKDLLHALADDVATREQRQQQAILQLQLRLEALLEQSQQHWSATERDVTALYNAQFGFRPKGENP